MKERDLMLQENGYRQCQIDVQGILLELVTEENRPLMIEIDRRIKEMIEIRILTEFAETQD